MAPDHSHLPIYRRISDEIVATIREGSLQPGQRVPSENELMRRFGVSNTTARKAQQELERDGWVVRIKGKGTFVRRRAVERSVDRRILSFTRNMLQEGRTPSTEVLGVRVRRTPHSVTTQGRRPEAPGAGSGLRVRGATHGEFGLNAQDRHFP